MFEQSSITHFELKNSLLLHVYASLNQPQISAGLGTAAEPAQAYFFIFETKQEKLELFIGLYFLSSQHRILYGSDKFLPELLPERMSQAESFSGEMGFLMDDLHLSRATSEEKQEILRTIPFFYRSHETYLQALSEKERQARDAQTQVSLSRETAAEKHSYFLEQYVILLSML